MRRKTRGVRLRLRASSGGCGTSRHTRPRYGQLFLLACLKAVYEVFRALYAPFFLQSNGMLPTQRFPRSKRIEHGSAPSELKSQSSSRMSVSDALLRASSTEPGSSAPQIIKTATKINSCVHISREQTRREWEVKLFPEDQLNPDRFGSVLIFRNVNNNRKNLIFSREIVQGFRGIRPRPVFTFHTFWKENNLRLFN